MIYEIKTTNDFEDFITAPASLVEFYLPTAYNYAKMEGRLKQFEELAGRKIKVARVHADHLEPLSRKYAVDTYPTFLVFSESDLLKKHEGLLDMDGLYDLCKQALNLSL